MYICGDTCDHERMPRPATGETKVRNVRVGEPLWQAAKAKAKAEGITVTDVIVRALTRYVSTPPRRRPPDEETGD